MSTLVQFIQMQRDAYSILLKYRSRFDIKNVSEITTGYLQSLAQRVDDIFNNFESTHGEILRKIHDDGINACDVPYLNEDLYYEFSEQYFVYKGKLLDMLSQFSVTYSPRSSTFVAPTGRADTTFGVEAKLPKIALPTFSGDYMEWVPFRDIYISLVHNNESLSKTQRFYYLKGTLAGEAASLIKTISATDANYDSAWNILESRYHNKRMIVGNLISKIFNIPNSDGGFQSIKTLLDSTQESLSSLGNLGINTQSWDPILIHLIAQKLDVQTRKEWEQSLKSSTEIPSCSEMFSFLERTFRTLESINDGYPTISKQKSDKVNKSFSHNKKTSCHSGKFSKTNAFSCIYCEKPHSLSKCFKFLALPLHSKNEFLVLKKVCRNCLALGHTHENCSSTFRCIMCKELHHTVLHSEERADKPQSLNTFPSSSNSNKTSNHVTSHSAQSFHSVLLYTMRLIVTTERGQFSFRALLDPGSQGSLISESAVQLMGIRKIKSHCRVVGIGDGNENLSKYSVVLDLFSRKNKFVLSCTALVLPRLSSYVPDPFSKNISMPNLDIECLADPFFHNSDPVDIILGSDVCSKIKIPTESFAHDELFFQNTYFGWVFSGSSSSLSSNRVHIHNANLDNILRSFWEQEEITQNRDFSTEEVACENLFKSTTEHTKSGHYMVNLPFRSILMDNSYPTVENNSFNAFKRLKHLEMSFSKRPDFAVTYKAFMREYESLHHMTKIGIYPNDILSNSYFLPHHGVFKNDSSTTKLRVVFDGSSHIKGHKSLNEELSPGPALQNDITEILTKWRRHKIAFSADIEKMFRQIDVCPEHRQFQQILWRFDPYEDISIYRLNTVTYGTTSAPYLAIRVLRQLAEDYKNEFPKAANSLLTDSYVDDILSGADSLDDAMLLHKSLCNLLGKGGCNLRKWTTNSKDLLDFIPEDHRESSQTISFDRDNVVKTLGIQWNTNCDTFSFKVNIDLALSATKRSILSDSARLYDPLGWLTPSTVIAKSLFKALWERGVDWDTQIPHDIEDKWLRFKADLTKLSDLRIPRWIKWAPGSKIELHSFCDASAVAYAAVVYSRVISPNGIFVNILQAKSKISPIKTISIPRLELCGAALLARLANKVKHYLRDLPIENIYYWSDSSTVLSWIRKSPSSWTVYVANRVAEIQRLSSPSDWSYVPTGINPADCASRGIFPQDLLENHNWWNGPEFLYKPSTSWPKNLSNLCTTEEEKKPKISTNVIGKRPYPELFSRFSKLQTLLRVTALCLRFGNNCRNPREKITHPLTLSEIGKSLTICVKLTQSIDFCDEIKMLSTNREINHSPMLKLMPFLDNNGIIRVGGRLQNSELPYDVKHPILLTKSNPLSKLIISDAHEKTLHGGLTLTLAYVNKHFWILSGTQLAKSIIQKCMKCFKYSAKASQQIMGNLPSVRLNVTRPFKHSGVDYAGPISVKSSTFRTTIISKGYICLFVCMVTKAIHLEAVSDLTTNGFLAAFRRFVSRRGHCSDIYSDCGTNFVGASKELRVLYQKSRKSCPEDLLQSLSLNGTQWHFNPPASPNFGGLWEAGVKSVKFHLKRILNDRVLSFEELSTLLCQIESCLNSRPLCPLSPDPSDFNALTPAHFLIGEPTNCIPEENLLDANLSRLSRWKTIESIKQHFWKRWQNEYLSRLQARPKWLVTKPNIKTGDLVLIVDERCGPGQWQLGRIKDTHPGPDGNTRVVSVLVKDKLIKRPISKICLLPVNSSEPTDAIANIAD